LFLVLGFKFFVFSLDIIDGIDINILKLNKTKEGVMKGKALVLFVFVGLALAQWGGGE